ncbi:unnamed protein product [Oikopleura dioica]|uniref:Uncharacterized protein n=1 Tax=Oikopleura dioica TaxID=34765 RepID=E4YKF6_OIKDI|nr:unnamed protein product [Oikopleura dioica]
MSTQSGYLGHKTKYVLHVLVCWGYLSVNGRKQKRRFESLMIMPKGTGTNGQIYDKSPELVKDHIIKSLDYIKANNIFDSPHKILILSDNASEYKEGLHN